MCSGYMFGLFSVFGDYFVCICTGQPRIVGISMNTYVAHVKLPESNSEKAEYTDDLSLSSR